MENRLDNKRTTDDKRATDNRRTISRQLLRLSRPYWPHITGIFLLGVIAAPIGLLLALPLKIAVDNVIGSRPLPHVLEALLPGALHGSKGASLLLAAGLLLFLGLATNLAVVCYLASADLHREWLVLDFRGKLSEGFCLT